MAVYVEGIDRRGWSVPPRRLSRGVRHHVVVIGGQKVRAAQTVTHASLGRIEVSTLARSLDFPPVSFDFLHHVVVAALLRLGM